MNTKIKLLLKYEQGMYDTISDAHNTFMEKKNIIKKFYNEFERAAENHMNNVIKFNEENGVGNDTKFDNIENFIDGMIYFWFRDFAKNSIVDVKHSDGTEYNDNEKLAHSIKYFKIGYWK